MKTSIDKRILVPFRGFSIVLIRYHKSDKATFLTSRKPYNVRPYNRCHRFSPLLSYSFGRASMEEKKKNKAQLLLDQLKLAR